MPTTNLLTTLAVSGLLVLAGSRCASAQDPAVVNAKTVQVKMENERVRVLEAILQPGEKEQLHSHPAYVTYVIAGGTVRNHIAGGTTVEAVLKTGDVLYRDAVVHWAENIGTTPIQLILVELKSP